jgi:DNA adenine methylase
MRYIGGKFRIRKQLVGFMFDYIKATNCFVEPFVGSANITLSLFGDNILVAPKRIIINDFHTDLAMMWQDVYNGWEPPNSCSEEEYEALRNAESSALRGFIGHSCSFGGIWFSKYAKDNSEKEKIIKPKKYDDEVLMLDVDEFGEEPESIIQKIENRNYCLNAKSSIMKVANILRGVESVEIYNLSYEEVPIPDGSVVYCDPPYKDTAKPGSGNDFDHEKFWQWVRELSGRCQVFVSEYVAPEDFECVLEIDVELDMNREKRVERLFKYNCIMQN